MFFIIIPIIFSSINRIDKISCAMELRGFGYKKNVHGIHKENLK